MARAVREYKLDSPTARAALKPKGVPYFRAIDAGIHLGYRKGNHAGKWVLRRYLGDERYAVETIGTADDHLTADEVDILSFHQAQARARKLASAAARGAPPATFTVKVALDAYFERLEHEGSKSVADAKGRAALHILPDLGGEPVANLTRERIGRWLKGIALQARHVRGKSGTRARLLGGPTSEDEKRRRKASANRTLTILRAALNQAFRDGLAQSNSAWRAVKPFREVEHARTRYFTSDEITRLMNAATGAFFKLLSAALFTGCRYSELTRLRADDFNADAGTAFVRNSKSGKARHVVLSDEGRRFFEALIVGKPSEALMLVKDNGSPWRASDQIRPMDKTCDTAGVSRGSFHILRHTAGSHLVMAGVPLNVVAKNLGHADTRMTEKHYAHLAPSYVAETIRKFAPTFGGGGAETKGD